MALAVRLVAVLVVLLAPSGGAFGQRPVAPPPHIPLDELAKEYKRWGLPVPAPDVQLVRLKRFRELEEDAQARFLAFRNPPARPGEAPRPPTGDEIMFDLFAEDAVLRKPSPADLAGVSTFYWEWLRLAAQFRLRGWNEAATAAYANALKGLSEDEPNKDEPPPTVLATLRQMAWGYWTGELLARASDRREVSVRLRELAKVEPELLTPRARWTLESLDLTLAPRTSKPGSVAALIDDLTDYWINEETGERNDAAYWKLVELGFDAVPALIEHLNDDRLTRAQFGGVNNFRPYTYRVRHLVSELLNGLSNGYFDGQHWDLRGDTIPPGEALKWWGAARQIGEERWLLEHAIQEEGPFPSPRSGVALRVIRAKYPHRLAAIYQTVLLKRPEIGSEQITKEIAASVLPRERKLALLEAGVGHRDARHRRSALEALAGIDGAAFAKHLLAALGRTPADVAFGEPNRNSELRVVELVRETGDRKCWDAVADLSRRGSPASRMILINTVSWTATAKETFPGRRECVRYLLGFLNDTARADEFWDGLPVVRDDAATQLALLFGVARYEELEALHSPRELSLLRERVRERAKRELARPAK